MITETEFKNAVDIVEKYNIQISEKIAELKLQSNFGKTLIVDWIEKQHRVGKTETRQTSSWAYGHLFACLYNHIESYPDIKYIEDITKNNFLRMRNGGMKTWEAFLELRTY